VHHLRRLTIGIFLLALLFGGVWLFKNPPETVYNIDRSAPGNAGQRDTKIITEETIPDASPKVSATPVPARQLDVAEPVGGAGRPAASPTPKPVKTTPAPRRSSRAIQSVRPKPGLTGPATDADTAAKLRVVELVNVERGKNGCGPVHSDARLDSAAQGHSADMAARGYFSHETPEGVDPWERARAAGYMTPTGENIAAGQRSAEDVTEAWMNSPGHRANILNCDSHAIGMGLARSGDGQPYWTQMFGSV
jgi:uncharacterized protein YkwD